MYTLYTILTIYNVPRHRQTAYNNIYCSTTHASRYPLFHTKHVNILFPQIFFCKQITFEKVFSKTSGGTTHFITWAGVVSYTPSTRTNKHKKPIPFRLLCYRIFFLYICINDCKPSYIYRDYPWSRC